MTPSRADAIVSACRRLALASLVALSSALAGCHQSVELLPGTDAGDDAALDAWASNLCAPAGQPCATDVDCCSGSCVSGVCAAATGCAPLGESCTTAAQCCSRVCAQSVTGGLTCQGLGGCAVDGELCVRDTDCCDTTPGSCAHTGAAAVGHCTASTTGCVSAGEICRVAGDVSATRDCCPSGSHGLCRPTPSSDVDRCSTERAAASCLLDGETCAVPSDCCSNVCTASSDGYVCVPACEHTGDPCSRDADCCTGACGTDRLCRGARSCEPLGSPCTSGSDCCTSRCLGSQCVS